MFQPKRLAAYCLTLLVAASAFARTATAATAVVPPTRLSALIGETSAQFRLAFRMRPNEAQQRQEQLDAAVAAWRAAPRTAANDEDFAKWLRGAIRASMPGQREALPPIPEFKAGVRVEKRATEPVQTDSAPSEADSPLTTETPHLDLPAADSSSSEPTPVIAPSTARDETMDPFRDDPVEESEQE